MKRTSFASLAIGFTVLTFMSVALAANGSPTERPSATVDTSSSGSELSSCGPNGFPCGPTCCTNAQICCPSVGGYGSPHCAAACQ
jgi:hypothetical protein